MTMLPLLIHSPDIPEHVREELRAAFDTQRAEDLAVAARLIHHELEVDCADARELVGLPPGCC